MSKDNNQRTNIMIRTKSIRDAMGKFTVQKKISDIGWIYHQIVYVEPMTLFPWTEKSYVHEFFDTENLGNLAKAYRKTCVDKEINWHTICDVHYIICENTIVPGGQFRMSPKILDISVNGMQYHAPNYLKIPFEMQTNIENRINTCQDAIDTALKTHAEMILLQPFEDFNKRTARIIMNWILINNGYTPIIFNNKTDKNAYRAAIVNYASGKKKEYNSFMLNCMERTQFSLIKVLNQSIRK